MPKNGIRPAQLYYGMFNDLYIISKILEVYYLSFSLNKFSGVYPSCIRPINGMWM